MPVCIEFDFVAEEGSLLYMRPMRPKLAHAMLLGFFVLAISGCTSNVPAPVSDREAFRNDQKPLVWKLLDENEEYEQRIARSAKKD